MAGLGLELLGRRSSALGNSVWWQKSLCVWGLWLSTLDSKRFDLKLTMAHNQDRLQNSDSSVVYGHGHIIYSHTASRCSLSLQSDVGDTPLRQAIKQPTMSLNGPPQKHISVYLLVAELRRRSEKGMHSFALTFLRTRNIHQFVSGTEFDASGRSTAAVSQENRKWVFV